MQLGFLYAFVALLAIFRVEPSEGIIDINNQLNNIISPPILPAVESILDINGDADSTEDEQKVRLQRESIVKDYGFVFKPQPIVLESNSSYKPSVESEGQAQSFSRGLEEAKLQIQKQSQSQSQAQGLGQSQQQIQYANIARTKVQKQFQSQELGLAQSQQQTQIQQSLNQDGAKLREKPYPHIQTSSQRNADDPESEESEAPGGLSGKIALVPPNEEEIKSKTRLNHRLKMKLKFLDKVWRKRNLKFRIKDKDWKRRYKGNPNRRIKLNPKMRLLIQNRQTLKIDHHSNR